VIRYKTVVISSMLDSRVHGEKRSTFVSATVELGGITDEQFRVEQLRVGKEVAIAAIQNALCRQEMSETEARTRVAEIKENYDGFIQRLEAKQQKQVENFLEKSEEGQALPQDPPQQDP
jgi:hypothetical protein